MFTFEFWKTVMESQDLVSVLRLIYRPIVVSLGLKCFRSCLGLEGYRSWSRVYCLETLNIARMWVSQTFVIQWVFSLLYLQIKNNQNRSEKCQKFEKFILEVVITFFWKVPVKSTNFEVLSLGLGIFHKVSVLKFSRSLGLESYSIDYITAEKIKESSWVVRHCLSTFALFSWLLWNVNTYASVFIWVCMP